MSNSNSTKSSNCPAHSPQELEPSENFYGVFHEDMIISKFGEIPETPFRLLDLPKEIRLKIYEMVLVLKEPVQEWSGSTSSACEDWDSMIRLRNIFRDDNIRDDGGYTPVNLLLACKQINHEGTAIWYGQNDFRFVGINGMSIAGSFHRMVTPRNLGYLTTVTLPMPFWSVRRHRRYDLVGGFDYLEDIQELNSSSQGHPEMLAAEYVVRSLANTNLKTLNLVLTDEYEYGEDWQGQPWDRIWDALHDLVIQKPNLKVHIFYLYLLVDDDGWKKIILQPQRTKFIARLTSTFRPRRPWTVSIACLSELNCVQNIGLWSNPDPRAALNTLTRSTGVIEKKGITVYNSFWDPFEFI